MKPTAFSRHLRKNQTEAERVLWGQLKAGRLEGIKFRRQHPVGPYFADFCSIDKKLIVELDGGQHAASLKEDATRTDFLEKRGFKVIRFWDHEVLRNLEAVLEAIRLRLVDAPSPPPLPNRERGQKSHLSALSLAPRGEGRVRGAHPLSKKDQK